MDAYSAGYMFGQLTGVAIVVGLIVWGIVAIVRNNSKQSKADDTQQD